MGVALMDAIVKEMLIYCHPGKNQFAKVKARFFLCLQIKHLRA